MKILLSLILLMHLPTFANNCHDAFDPETEKQAEWNEKEFKRGYWAGVKKTLGEAIILGAIWGGSRVFNRDRATRFYLGRLKTRKPKTGKAT